MNRTLCSHVDPSPRRRESLDRTVPRGQWKAVLHFLGELFVTATFAVAAIEIMKRTGLYGVISE